MRRFLLLVMVALAALLAVWRAIPAIAQNDPDRQAFRSEKLGISFDYPADWTAREQIPTRTVTASSKRDLDLVQAGKAPDGLLFSISVSTFRQVGAQRLDDFGPILQKIAQAADATPTSVIIGGADGLQVDTLDIKQDVATRTALVSIGKRRVAVLRGVSTIAGWMTGNSKKQFDDLVDTVNFFPQPNSTDGDAVGRVLWQLPADKMTDIADLTLNANGTALLVASRSQGIWQVGVNGTPGDALVKPAGVGQFDGLSVLRNGQQFIVDSATNSLWTISPDSNSGTPTRLIGGKTGNGRGAFGAGAPLGFAFGLRGAMYVLDNNDKGLRIQVFNRVGDWLATWELGDALPQALDHPLLSTDDIGNAYLVARNSPGIIKISPAGKVVTTDLGKDVLQGTGPLALTIDRFDTFFVATSDQGIFNLSPDGKLLGIIGEPYDEARPPKPGQIGKPVALTMGDAGRLLYVADSGKYPQIVAFTLNGNTALNIAAGTRAAGPLTYGQNVRGEISEKTFIDAYTFDGVYGDVVTITMEPTDGSQIDPYLEIVSPTGGRLAVNDDAKNGTGLRPKSAQIKGYRLPYNMTYTIRATRYGGETTTVTGGYTLTLTLDRPGKKPAGQANSTP